MTSRRLTATLRSATVKNCINATFRARREALDEQFATLGDQVFEAAVSITERQLMAQLPRDFFDTIYSVGLVIESRAGSANSPLRDLYEFRSKKFGRTRYSRSKTNLPLAAGRSCPAVLRNGSAELPIELPLCGLIIRIDTQFKQLEDDIETLEGELNRTVLAAKTERQLIEIWPDAERYIPKPPAAAKPIMVRPEALNNMIQQMRSA